MPSRSSGVALRFQAWPLVNLQLDGAVLDADGKSLDGQVGGQRTSAGRFAGRTASRGAGTRRCRRSGSNGPSASGPSSCEQRSSIAYSVAVGVEDADLAAVDLHDARRARAAARPPRQTSIVVSWSCSRSCVNPTSEVGFNSSDGPRSRRSALRFAAAAPPPRGSAPPRACPSGHSSVPSSAPWTTFSASRPHLRRVGESSMPISSITKWRSSPATSSTVLPFSSSEMIDAGGLRDRAALAVEAQVLDPVAVEPDVHAHLVAAQRVAVVELGVVRLELARSSAGSCSGRGCIRGRAGPCYSCRRSRLRVLRERVDEPVDLVARVVDREGGAGGRRHAEHAASAAARSGGRRGSQTASRSQISAMSCGWMPSSAKRDDAAAVVGVGRPEDRSGRRPPRSRSSAYAVSSRSWARTASMPSVVEVVDRRAEARPPRRSPACRPRTSPAAAPRSSARPRPRVIIDAAAEEGRHLLEQLAARPQHADPGRAEHLVAGEARRSRRRVVGHVDAASAGTAWAPSTAPARRRRARAAAISATGLIVPSTFETWATATSFTPPARDELVELVEVEPALVVDRRRTRAARPAPAHSSCHGTMFEWCSISRDRARRRPRPRASRPRCRRTRLIASVALRTKTISAAARADEPRDRSRAALVERGRLGGELVDAAVDVGVGAAGSRSPSPRSPLPASARWRRCRGRRRGLPLELAREDREVRADLLDGARQRGLCGRAPPVRRPPAPRASRAPSRSPSPRAAGQLGAALLDDPAVQHDVDEVGLDVAEDALVVGDDQHAEVGSAHRR